MTVQERSSEISKSPDLLFGKLAVHAGYLTHDQVQSLIRQQEEFSKEGRTTAFGELCLSQGLMTDAQVNHVLLIQDFSLLKEEDKLFGMLAIKNGLVSKDVVQNALHEQTQIYIREKRLPKRLGEILTERRVLTEQQVNALLKAQERLRNAEGSGNHGSSTKIDRPSSGSKIFSYRTTPSIRTPVTDPTRTGRVTCPHCWNTFPVEETLFIARHQELLGDPVLGPDHPKRFLPSRFTPAANALDPEGIEAPDRACCRCHLRLPRTLHERGSLFFSLVGAPASGKSYFLSCLIWELRKKLPGEFHFDFSDADAETNTWVNEYERILFLPADPHKPAFMKKTESQGELSTQVTIDGMTIALPKPSIFTLTPRRNHPRFERNGRNMTRNLVFYDNAGEDFKPRMDTASNPATQHLIRSQAIFFLYDPTADPRVMQKLEGIEPASPARPRVSERQETLLTEMVDRISRYRGLSRQDKVDIPLLIVVGKFDAWSCLLPRQPIREPFCRSRTMEMSALDLSEIASTSLLVRHFLLSTCPEIVHISEGFSRYVHYIPISALGHTPKYEPDNQYVQVMPRDIKPQWVTVPFLLALSQIGYLPVVPTPPSMGEVKSAASSLNGDFITVHVPETNVQYSLPLSFAGCVLRCPQTGVEFRVPSLDVLSAANPVG